MNFEEQLKRRLGGTMIYTEICEVNYHVTKWDKVKSFFRNFSAYITRYKLVDTWTIHDGCD